MTQLIANIRLPWLLLTLLVFGGLVKLGLWQSERAVYKEQRLHRIEKLTHLQPLSLTSVLEQRQEERNDLPVKLAGNFAANILFFLDNQPNNGRLGYRVFQVLESDFGDVLVNLGWVEGSVRREVLPAITAIEGFHTFKGHVRVIEKGIVLMEDNLTQAHWPLRVQHIALDKFSTLINKELLPFVVYLDKKEQLGYKKNWQPIVMPPEKHRGYAFQWFSLATAWLLLMFWVLVKVNQKNNTNNKV